MILCKDIELSKRGNILDCRGRVLATSVKKYSIFIDPTIIKNFNKIKDGLLKIGIKINNLSKYSSSNKAYIPILHNVDLNTISKIRNMKLRGIGFESRYIRQYPEGKLLSHILGITDIYGNGVEGIEKICNRWLIGENIEEKKWRDGRGNIILDKHIDKSKKQGCNVRLCINTTIQYIVEQELRHAMEKYKAKKAICIVQNPINGNILAMVSLPDFNPSYKISNIKILKNSAISDMYEPGSTFKVVTISAALDKDIIRTKDHFYVKNEKFKIFGHIIKDHNMINKNCISLSKAIEQSSNIIMIKIANKIGSKYFYHYIRKFGFHSLTGIDLPGEIRGMLVNLENWNSLSMPTISFGQGIGVTPIQIINAFSAIANNGVLMKPLIIKSIENKNNEKFNNLIFKPRKIRRVISKKTAILMKNLLKNVVDFGTGKKAKIKGYSVGGKTGTSQKIDNLTGTYSKKCYIASFCGMIPAINPKIVILVIIDEPKGKYYASYVASPLFAKIAEKVIKYLKIKQDENNYNN
jgi:cell division protein FtsI (penicillin-binding protein 3)